MPYGGAAVDYFQNSNGQTVSTQPPAFRNRIINGDMRIDQRNAGASLTPTNQSYGIDRWKNELTQASKFSIQQSSTAPVGFINSMLITSLSSYAVTSTDQFNVGHYIEGLNVYDLGWGTINAQTVTLSFWIRSSLTGTFGGAINNGAGNRSYPFQYTINSANTWEYKTVVIPGDTTGTWPTNNTAAIRVCFSLGCGSTLSGTVNTWAGAFYVQPTGATSLVGTNGATLYITGVQLEVGSFATNFDFREYTTEMNKCKRYFQKSYKQSEKPGTVQGDIRSGMCFHNSSSISGQAFGPTIMLPVTMRTDPSVTIYDHLGATPKVTGIAASTGQTAGVSYNDIGTSDTRLYIRCYDIAYYGFGFHYTLSAEL